MVTFIVIPGSHSIAVLGWPEEQAELLDTLKTQGRAILFVRFPASSARDVARYHLRLAVTELLSLAYSYPADQIRIPSGTARPLSVALHQQHIFLSFAHDDGLSVAGISTTAPLGIDLMKVDDQPDWQQLASLFLGPTLTKKLLAYPAIEQVAAFTQEWTRLEACSKLSGDGLHEWSMQREANLVHQQHNTDVLVLTLPQPYCGTVLFKKRIL